MKFFCATLIAALFAIVSISARAEMLRAGDNVAVIGDSITEQKIYSVYIEDYLLMCAPVTNLESHQFGWSGEAATGFLKRVESDVLPFHPTVATTLYGMNDGLYAASNPRVVAAFHDNTVAFIKKLQAGGVRLILVGSPGAVDSEQFKTWRLARCSPDSYNQTLLDLGNAAQSAAQETGAIFVDVHTPMMAAMEKAKAKYGADYPTTLDGVHPLFNGHLVMAYAFLKALGCSGDIGAITLDEKTGAATGTDGHKIISASPTKIEIESTRYPFCFVDDPAKKGSSRDVLDFVPFNEELNRFVLVVKNISTPGMKVKWGASEKVFTAEQLAAGINLAAEFLDNPFNDEFAKVEAAMKKQQAFETPATKILLHSMNMSAWQTNMPEETDTLKKLQSDVVGKSRNLEAAARSTFTPVRHTLELTPVP
jgi:lysophospholipase L1-like esterase